MKQRYALVLVAVFLAFTEPAYGTELPQTINSLLTFIRQ